MRQIYLAEKDGAKGGHFAAPRCSTPDHLKIRRPGDGEQYLPTQEAERFNKHRRFSVWRLLRMMTI
jgi:hypothetical protein